MAVLTACNSAPANPSPSPSQSAAPSPSPSESPSAQEPSIAVEYDLDAIHAEQARADEDGSSPLLDPLQAALNFIDLQFYPQGVDGNLPISTGDLEIVEEGEQTVIRVSSDTTATTTIYLRQLAKQGDGGIWSVIGYDEDQARRPSIAGISLYDSREKVDALLGADCRRRDYEEAGHFPEPYYSCEYENGIEIIFGRQSDLVYQITATAPQGATNLGYRVGDGAREILEAYRERYVEPESIHGGKLYGVFKVENGQALLFDFDGEAGVSNGEIDENAEAQRIVLTYPTFLDDSF